MNKRMLQYEDFDNLGNPMNKRKYEETATATQNEYDDREETDYRHHHLQQPLVVADSEEHDCNVTTNATTHTTTTTTTTKKTAEKRLEFNRKRAKDIRKRKKIMFEDMQKQLVILHREQNKLQMENQTQLEEITFLRKMNQLLTSSNIGHQARTIAPPPATRLSDSEIFNISRGIGNLDDRYSNPLLASLHTESIGRNTAFLHPSDFPSSIPGLGHQTLNDYAYPFGN